MKYFFFIFFHFKEHRPEKTGLLSHEKISHHSRFFSNVNNEDFMYIFFFSTRDSKTFYHTQADSNPPKQSEECYQSTPLPPPIHHGWVQ